MNSFYRLICWSIPVAMLGLRIMRLASAFGSRNGRLVRPCPTLDTSYFAYADDSQRVE